MATDAPPLPKPPPFEMLDEDLRTCAFGPDYFYGCRMGAMITGVSVALIGRHRQRVGQRLIPKGSKLTLWDVDTSAYCTMWACRMSAVVKLFKAGTSHVRAREFEWDEFVATELSTVEDRAKLRAMEALRRDAEKAQRNASIVDAAAKERFARTGGRLQTQMDRDTMPTYWDGVSVGVWGSLQDAYNPTKAPEAYLYLRAGRAGCSGGDCTGSNSFKFQ